MARVALRSWTNRHWNGQSSGSRRHASGAGTRKAGSRRRCGARARRSRRSAPRHSRSRRRCRSGSARRCRRACAARCCRWRGTSAEIKGLLNNAIGRLERLEQELIAERNARLDDLTLLVELDLVGLAGRRPPARAHRAGRDGRDRVAARPRRCRLVAHGGVPVGLTGATDSRIAAQATAQRGDRDEDRDVSEQDVLGLLAGVVPVQQLQVAEEPEDDERHGRRRARASRARSPCRAHRRRSSRRRPRRAAGRRGPASSPRARPGPACARRRRARARRAACRARGTAPGGRCRRAATVRSLTSTATAPAAARIDEQGGDHEHVDEHDVLEPQRVGRLEHREAEEARERAGAEGGGDAERERGRERRRGRRRRAASAHLVQSAVAA